MFAFFLTAYCFHALNFLGEFRFALMLVTLMLPTTSR